MNAEAITPPETVFANEGETFEKHDAEALKEMWAEATERIANDNEPRHYIMRLDKKTLVKTEGELKSCQAKNVPLRYGINERHALHLLSEEGARNNAKKKRRQANKRARKQRKLNVK